MERGDLTGAILDGRYRVIGPIAEGAMGVVYRAERVKLGRIVAIKVLHDVLPNELSGRKRFEIEAMAMAKLEHPHCASVLDVGVYGDRPFVVMDFVNGENLKDLIARGPVAIPRATEIVRQVLSGLAHAHEHGIIHRDIKPANIVLSHKTGLGDHVKILDFGLARLHHTEQNLTSGIVVGTPAYMAPEQVRGERLDHRADLYACGVLLFELLTSGKPFHSEKDDPIEVCRMHLSSPIPRLDDKLPGTDFGELEPVVAKALAKRRDDRYASAQDYAAALDAAFPRRASTQTIQAIPPGPPGPPGPRTGPLAAAVPAASAAPSTGSSAPGIGPSAAPKLNAGPKAASGPARAGAAIDDMSYPPAVEVRSTDVLSVMAADAGVSPGAGRANGAASDARGEDRSGAGGDARRDGPPHERAEASADARDEDRPGRSGGSPRPRRRWRWTWVAALGGIVIAGGVAIALVTAGGGAPVPGDASAGSTPAGPADPGREIAAHASELAAQGEREAALDLLARSRKQYPASAALAYTAGRLFFTKFYWTDGLKSFRDAIRLEPSYRADPELIKTVLRGFITTPGYNDELASFLRDDIGSAAQPFLEETARDHPNAAIRSRAASALRRHR